ncbi:MAG TPA: hypothetical protein VM013_00760 [Dehalococcoidia bacterium]|nr:hypothetical protein [Dehalococcoidia bacterium]
MDRKLRADAIVETAAQQMRQLLREAVALLDPFPAFPGSFFTLGIEVEGGLAEDPERGCIVLGPDGELHELEISIDFTRGQTDPVAARDETLKPLEFHPRDYIVYAYDALTRVTELLMEQQAEKAEG